MLENLAAKGIKQQGHPDIRTLKMLHPEVLYGWGLVEVKRGQSGLWMATDTCPSSIISGYRDYQADPAVKNSPHNWGAAVDVLALDLDSRDSKNWPALLEEQIRIVRLAVITTGIFNRGGLYPTQNTCHVDVCDNRWMAQYGGTKFWVKWPFDAKQYTGFTTLDVAADFAKNKIYTHARRN